MKRSPLPKRKKPLKRGRPPKPVSDRRRNSGHAQKRVELRAALMRRSNGRCEMPRPPTVVHIAECDDRRCPCRQFHHHPECNGYGQDPAHILPASLGGDDYDEDNHLFLNRRCHEWLETHIPEAIARGANRGTRG